MHISIAYIINVRKEMKVMKKFSAIIAAVATIVATIVASSACWAYIYQPEEPASLRDR